ncbi:hypothetical protein Anapl_15475 [Anas platyrhynchos]|uniref:Uncharacterized protein n=1 Tax=Anas platyrhynchos TaxID=8839 RepID=R0K0E9_ANAPL|nr:hypothetical protein Anapl_15475 [Anas platyrhynchos]
MAVLNSLVSYCQLLAPALEEAAKSPAVLQPPESFLTVPVTVPGYNISIAGICLKCEKHLEMDSRGAVTIVTICAAGIAQGNQKASKLQLKKIINFHGLGSTSMEKTHTKAYRTNSIERNLAPEHPYSLLPDSSQQVINAISQIGKVAAIYLHIALQSYKIQEGRSSSNIHAFFAEKALALHADCSVAEMEDSAPSFICVGFQCLQPDDQDAGCEQQPCCSLPVHVLNACTRCMQMQRCLQALVLAVPHAVADEGHGTLIPQGLAALQPHASRPEHLVTKA